MSAQPHAAPPRSPALGPQERRRFVLRAIVAFGVLSTLLHFTHNFLRVEDYPQATWASNRAVQVAIVVSWPLLTAIGLYGYRRYREGRYRSAHTALAVYAVLPLATLGHFTVGKPDIPLFWYATIFTDALAGVMVVAFVLWSLSRPSP